MTDGQAREFAGLIIDEIKPYISAHKEKYNEFLKKHLTSIEEEKFRHGKL